jgi:hypothetical protein
MAGGGDKGFSWAAFFLLAGLGLAGLWWLKRAPAPAEGQGQAPAAAAAQARQPRASLAALLAELRRQGVTPALRRGPEPGVGGFLSARLPRAANPAALRQALAAAGFAQVAERREQAQGLTVYHWRFTQGGALLLNARMELSRRPALALLVDDWGYYLTGLDSFLALPQGVSAAVFPGQAKSRVISQRLAAAGHEVLLHLPMEPSRPMALVSGTLLSSMSDEEIRSLTLSHLSAVPEAVGVNNHEGSKGTCDPRVMRLVAAACRERGVYFLDSLTTPQSLGQSIARQAGVRTAARQVFLDNEEYEDSIEEALRKAAHIALTKGQAIAIGHPHPATLRVLARLAPELQQQGIELVPVSELVR